MNNPQTIEKHKILLVIDSLHCGGAQRQLCYLALGLKLLGHHVKILVYHTEYDFFAPYLRERNIDVIYASRDSKIQTIKHIVTTVNEHKFSWVISYLDGPNVYALAAKKLAALKSVHFKVCVSDRSSAVDGRFRGKEYWRRQLYRFADAVVANSNFHAESLKCSFSSFSDRVHAILNCVDKKFFEHRLNPDSLKKTKRRTFAVVGQINRNKNLHGLVRAMNLCKENLEHLPVIRWAGRVGEGAEQYFEEQKVLIQDYGLEDNFIFLGSVDDIAKMLSTTDGLVHPSLREGLPNAVCEALTIGLPVAIGDVSDAKVLVGEDRGFLFDPKSPLEMAAAISQLTKLSGEQVAMMANAACAFADENFKVEKMAEKYQCILNSKSLVSGLMAENF